MTGSKLPRAAICAVVISALPGFAGCRGQSSQPAVARVSGLPDSPIGPRPSSAQMPSPTVPEEDTNPLGDDERTLQDGRRFFVAYNCAGCHGDHGGGGMGPSLRDTTWIYGGRHENIADSIADGRAYGMPAWGTMLTPAQIWQLTAYIKSMRTPREPRPPRG